MLRRPSTRRVLLVVCTWVMCTLAITGLVRLFTQVDRTIGERLHQNGVATVAKVTYVDADNHGSLEYAFTVNGDPYSGSYSGAGIDGPVSDLSVGQSIHIFYDKTDPLFSCYCDPRLQYAGGRLWSDLAIYAFFSAFLTAVLVGLARWVCKAVVSKPPATTAIGE